MRFIDITRPLEKEMIVYPGDFVPSFIQRDHGQYLISELHLSSHTGTHIDAPSHYLKSGEPIDAVPFRKLVGPCRVIDVSAAGNRITAGHLNGRLGSEKRILLKTRFSKSDTFENEYPCLALDAARMITAAGVCCIGIDSPSIETFGCDGSVHRELLGRGCLILELLSLGGVQEGIYDMIALPLRLTGLDGAPARVLLSLPEEK